MGYVIIYVFLSPFLWILSFFRKKSNDILLIQTAKIGDYVNTSIVFDKVKKFDIVIDKVNEDFSKFDERIGKYYVINGYKKGIFAKLKLAFMIFFSSYEKVYIFMPNGFNLFLARCSFAYKKITILHYASKWYEKILMVGFEKIVHEKYDLTLKSYLRMFDEDDIFKYKKIVQMPLQTPKNDIINSQKFKVGISLSAGNDVKTIDKKTWSKIFGILGKIDCDIFIFGLEKEQKYLENLGIKEDNMHSLMGKIELKELPFYLSKINLYISTDTGNSYIANSFDVPVINFSGPCCNEEQRPVGANVLMVDSNVQDMPISFVFETYRKKDIENLYEISDKQQAQIEEFIVTIYRDFRYP